MIGCCVVTSNLFNPEHFENLPSNKTRVDAGNFDFNGIRQSRSSVFNVHYFQVTAKIYDDKIRWMIIKTPKKKIHKILVFISA